MKKNKLRVALMSALVALGGVGLLLTSCDSGNNETTTDKYTVTYTASDDYTVSIASGTEYAEGDTVSFTVTAAEGKTLTDVTANGTSLGAGGSYSFTMPGSDVVITVTVADASTSYTFIANLSGSQYVGETLTASATVNGTATTDFTMTSDANNSLVSINNSDKTVELLAEGEATVVFTLEHEGTTLTDSVTLNIADTTISDESLLFTIDPADATNLKADISSTYKSSGTDIRDEYNGYTIMYTTSNNLGIANESYGGYGSLGTFQARSGSGSENLFESFSGLSVTSVVVDFYGTYSTYSNFPTITVGDVSNDSPVLLDSEATNVYYTSSSGGTYEINRFTYQYYFGDNANGYLSITGYASYAIYFNNIRVYGEAYEMGAVEPEEIVVSASNDQIFVNDTSTLSYSIEPRRATGVETYTVEYSLAEGSDSYVSLSGDTVTGVALGEATVIATVTAESTQKTYTGSTTISVVDESSIQVDNISDINSTGTQYTIRGVVVAKNSRNAVVHDGTAGVVVYDSSSSDNVVTELSIGDYIQVSGTTSTYSNGYQFEQPTVVQLEKDNAPVTPDEIEATALDSTVVSGLTSSGYIPTTAVVKYSWTATVTNSGNYDLFSVDGTSYTMETPYGGISSDIEITYGATYELEGYYVGYYSSYRYFVISSASLVEGTEPEVEPATIVENATLSDVLADTNFDGKTLYKVSGAQVQSFTRKDYGRMYVTDGTNSVYLYGSNYSQTAESLVERSGAYSYDYNYGTSFDQLSDFVVGVEVEVWIILYTSGSYTNYYGCVVNYSQVEPITATIDQGTSLSLDIGQTQSLTTTTNPELVSLTPTWSSDNTAVASVDEDGVVTAEGTGTTTVRATYSNSVEATISVTVSDQVYEAADPIGTYTYNLLSALADTGYTNTLTTSTALTALNDVTDTTATNNLISTVEAVERVYTNGSAGSSQSPLKFSAASNLGSITFATTTDVSSVVLTLVPWGTDTPIVDVNGTTLTLDQDADGTGVVTKDYTFEFNATKSITIGSSTSQTRYNRFGIVAMAFYA